MQPLLDARIAIRQAELCRELTTDEYGAEFARVFEDLIAEGVADDMERIAVARRQRWNMLCSALSTFALGAVIGSLIGWLF